ncbi:putative F-box/FBD/LRR-repeat protein At4g13965 [Gossypium arboreum]|uniref:putative F-box/FBD/LRR-repeat protein At4g13965 n=1 Tax=Gossypium arboreum TaxID=29729 RepID=UPI0022F15598|nr:putative F-box/FBD/LRR-repeat protein At4g13965 [Gossypium arboreum]
MATNDFISNLHNEVLARIISDLPAIEAIRTTILSKRWKDLWRYASRLDFDPKGVRKLYGDDVDDPREEISRVVKNIENVLLSHKRNLISCRIVHLLSSCRNGDLEKWIKYLTSEKKVQELAFRCDDFQQEFYRRSHSGRGLNLPLKQVRIFSQTVKTVELVSLRSQGIYLSTQSLGVLVLHSMKFQAKNLVIHAPNLRVFTATRKPITKNSDNITKIAEILEYCTHLLTPVNYKANDPMEDLNLFMNLRELTIDLDLNDRREMLILCIVLQRCLSLHQLEINIEESRSEIEEATRDYSSVNNRLPYPETKLWEKRGLCDCITFTLKQVSIKGFKGKDGEMEFPRHLITKGAKLKRIEIWCNHDCSREGGEATLGLLSLPRSSIDVSILLKPPPQFDGSFGRWVSTLN